MYYDQKRCSKILLHLEMFYLNTITIEQLFLFVEHLDQFEVRSSNWIPKLAIFQNLRWNSNKTFLKKFNFNCSRTKKQRIGNCSKEATKSPSVPIKDPWIVLFDELYYSNMVKCGQILYNYMFDARGLTNDDKFIFRDF